MVLLVRCLLLLLVSCFVLFKPGSGIDFEEKRTFMTDRRILSVLRGGVSHYVNDHNNHTVRDTLAILFVYSENMLNLEKRRDIQLHVSAKKLYNLFNKQLFQQLPQKLVEAMVFFCEWKQRDADIVIRYLNDNVQLLRTKRSVLRTKHEDTSEEEHVVNENFRETIALLTSIGKLDDVVRHVMEWGAADSTTSCSATSCSTTDTTDEFGLETHVRSIVEQAVFDVLQLEIEKKDFSRLFIMLKDIKKIMLALVCHSPRTINNLNEYFDVEFLEQQAQAHVLTVDLVARQMRFVVQDCIKMWCCPNEDEQIDAWVDFLTQQEQTQDLFVFLNNCMVHFIKQCTKHLTIIVNRLVDLRSNMTTKA